MDDPGPTADLVGKIILLFTLILVNAFFAMSEMAIVTLNDNKIDRMADEGHKKAKLVKRLTENSSAFLSTIQIGVTLAGFLTSASASETFVNMLADSLGAVSESMGIPMTIVRGFSLVVITIVTSYFSLVLGELAPKRIALRYPEKISFGVVKLLLFIKKIATPFVKILTVSTNAIVRIFGIDPNADDEVFTEEEIRMMVDVGEEKGVIEEVQKEMIENIFEFDDIDAGDIMTHRTDLAAINVDRPVEDVVKIAVEEGYSRIPVYEEDIDNIIGIIFIKDLLKYVGKKLPQNISLKGIMREPMYVPESKLCGELFKEMTASHTHLAVVVDEYGGTAGIVTVEDLLEAIVGSIQDEYDTEDSEVSQINENTFTVEGTMFIDKFNELVGDEIPDGDYDTVGGFIISQLGYLPKDGETTVAEYKNITFTVLNVEERRIGKVKVEVTPVAEEDDEKDSERTSIFRKSDSSSDETKQKHN